MTGPIIDGFGGPGGWAEGLRTLGLAEVGIELGATTCATRRAAGHRTIRADVASFPLGHLTGRVWGLILSPPCPDFSRAGKRQGLDGPTGRLTLEVPRWVEAVRPEWVACEQVEDVLPLWRQFAAAFAGLGYSTWAGILNAADYGVPQTRRRAILMASRARRAAPPPPTHFDDRRGGSLFGLAPWVTMAQALGWNGELVNGNQPKATRRRTDAPASTIAFGHNAARVVLHTNRDQRPDGTRQTRAADVPTPAVTSPADQWVVKTAYGYPSDDPKNGSHEFDPEHRPAHVVTEKARDWLVRTGNNSMRTGRTDADLERYERTADRPAPTLDTAAGGKWTLHRPATTVQGDPLVGRPGHKHRDHGEGQFDQGAVKITVRDALILQGFRPDYPVQGTRTAQFRQVGNAVPPPLAAAIIRQLTTEAHP
jgi:DNA (cytosine-5)-methyltransferase 1